MTHVDLGAIFIDETNLNDVIRVYKPLLPTQPKNTTEPQSGDVIVIRRITLQDLFDKDMVEWHENYWLATREEFDDRFETINDDGRKIDFAVIRPKK